MLSYDSYTAMLVPVNVPINTLGIFAFFRGTLITVPHLTHSTLFASGRLVLSTLLLVAAQKDVHWR